MTIKDFFSFSRNRYFWLHLLGMVLFVAAAIYATLKGIDIYTQHGQSVEVPDVKGMSLDYAETALRSRSLRIAVIDSTYISGYPAGAVFEQNPGAGSQVKKDRLIFVTVNTTHIPQKTIPDVIDNCSLREAQSKIESAGFTLGENEYIQGETDWIYGVKYEGRSLEPGAKVPVGSTLVLVVGDEQYSQREAEADSLGLNSEEEGIVDDSWF